MTEIGFTRPDPGRPAPSGCEFVAVPDPDWRVMTNGVAGVPGRQCRYLTRRTACGEAAVARMNRGGRRHFTWWSYCGEHMYGRWIEDGVVMVWHVREIGESS